MRETIKERHADAILIFSLIEEAFQNVNGYFKFIKRDYENKWINTSRSSSCAGYLAITQL